jgi:hypothetical protein
LPFWRGQSWSRRTRLRRAPPGPAPAPFDPATEGLPLSVEPSRVVSPDQADQWSAAQDSIYSTGTYDAVPPTVGLPLYVDAGPFASPAQADQWFSVVDFTVATAPAFDPTTVPLLEQPVFPLFAQSEGWLAAQESVYSTGTYDAVPPTVGLPLYVDETEHATPASFAQTDRWSVDLDTHAATFDPNHVGNTFDAAFSLKWENSAHIFAMADGAVLAVWNARVNPNSSSFRVFYALRRAGAAEFDPMVNVGVTVSELLKATRKSDDIFVIAYDHNSFPVKLTLHKLSYSAGTITRTQVTALLGRTAPPDPVDDTYVDVYGIYYDATNDLVHVWGDRDDAVSNREAYLQAWTPSLSLAYQTIVDPVRPVGDNEAGTWMTLVGDGGSTFFAAELDPSVADGQLYVRRVAATGASHTVTVETGEPSLGSGLNRLAAIYDGTDIVFVASGGLEFSVSQRTAVDTYSSWLHIGSTSSLVHPMNLVRRLDGASLAIVWAQQGPGDSFTNIYYLLRVLHTWQTTPTRLTPDTGNDINGTGAVDDTNESAGLIRVLYKHNATELDTRTFQISDVPPTVGLPLSVEPIPPSPAQPDGWAAVVDVTEATAPQFDAAVVPLTQADIQPVFAQNDRWEAPWRPPSAYEACVLGDRPVAYWRLDDTVGPALDSSGQGHTGTYNAGFTRGVSGLVEPSNNAVDFAGGDNDLIDFGDIFDFVGTANYSVEMWVRPTVVDGNFRRLIQKGATGAEGWFVISQSTNGVYAGRVVAGVEVNTAPGVPLVANQITHVVATYDGATIRVYLNASLRAEKADARSLNDSAVALRVAASGNSGSGFAGRIDEVAVYDFALTSEQIVGRYVCGSGAVISGLPLSVEPVPYRSPDQTDQWSAYLDFAEYQPVVFDASVVPLTQAEIAVPFRQSEGWLAAQDSILTTATYDAVPPTVGLPLFVEPVQLTPPQADQWAALVDFTATLPPTFDPSLVVYVAVDSPPTPALTDGWFVGQESVYEPSTYAVVAPTVGLPLFLDAEDSRQTRTQADQWSYALDFTETLPVVFDSALVPVNDNQIVTPTPAQADQWSAVIDFTPTLPFFDPATVPFFIQTEQPSPAQTDRWTAAQQSIYNPSTYTTPAPTLGMPLFFSEEPRARFQQTDRWEFDFTFNPAIIGAALGIQIVRRAEQMTSAVAQRLETPVAIDLGQGAQQVAIGDFFPNTDPYTRMAIAQYPHIFRMSDQNTLALYQSGSTFRYKLKGLTTWPGTSTVIPSPPGAGMNSGSDSICTRNGDIVYVLTSGTGAPNNFAPALYRMSYSGGVLSITSVALTAEEGNIGLGIYYDTVNSLVHVWYVNFTAGVRTYRVEAHDPTTLALVYATTISGQTSGTPNGITSHMAGNGATFLAAEAVEFTTAVVIAHFFTAGPASYTISTDSGLPANPAEINHLSMVHDGTDFLIFAEHDILPANPNTIGFTRRVSAASYTAWQTVATSPGPVGIFIDFTVGMRNDTGDIVVLYSDQDAFFTDLYVVYRKLGVWDANPGTLLILGAAPDDKQPGHISVGASPLNEPANVVRLLYDKVFSNGPLFELVLGQASSGVLQAEQITTPTATRIDE